MQTIISCSFIALVLSSCKDNSGDQARSIEISWNQLKDFEGAAPLQATIEVVSNPPRDSWLRIKVKGYSFRVPPTDKFEFFEKHVVVKSDIGELTLGLQDTYQASQKAAGLVTKSEWLGALSTVPMKKPEFVQNTTIDRYHHLGLLHKKMYLLASFHKIFSFDR